MRVLHVYSGNLYGGVETLLRTLARERGACEGMEPHFALCYDGWVSGELAKTGVPMHKLGEVRVRFPLSIWRARRRMRALLRAEAFDVVICHSFWTEAIFGPAVRAMRVPLAFWLHGPTDGRHWLERWARRTPPDLAICNSHYTAGTLPLLYPGVRGEVVYSPVQLEERRFTRAERDEVREELATPHGAIVIVQVSRMEEWKGHRLHLAALGRMKDDPRWVCWQVGRAQRPEEEVYLAGLRRQAEELGIADRVRWVGWWPDLPKLLAAADLFCQPNTAPEPLGLTFLEALWAKLPVVSTSMGGAKEIVDPARGILVGEGDPAALAAALGSLLADADARRRLGDAGPERVREFCDPGVQLPLLQRLLSNILRPAFGR